jgi:hypothetical protein
MADGRLGKCKECTKRDVTNNRAVFLLEIRAYDRERAKAPERAAVITKNARQWRRKNPRKYAAHLLVNNGIRDGKLKKEGCSVCGVKAHAHHENYDNPLEVTWLCAVHHSQRHKEMKAEGIIP